MYPENPPKLVPSYVCFADILGYSELSRESLKQGNGNDFLRRLRNALGVAYERVRDQSKNWSKVDDFLIKVFTDNIVVGYPLTNLHSTAGEPELGKIFSVFSEFQIGLVMEGFLVRGGIAAGDHFMDDDVVFGEALLEAVAEDKNGGAPRISLAPSAIEILRLHLGFYEGAEHAPQSSDLLEDADGSIFINYLNEAFVGFPEAGIYMFIFEKHKKTIVEGLEKYKGVPDVRAKFEWAARYHNYVCRSFRESHPIPNDPDANPEQVAANSQAQELIIYEIDIESYTATPGKITLTPVKRKSRA